MSFGGAPQPAPIVMPATPPSVPQLAPTTMKPPRKPMQPTFDDGLKCQLVLDAVMEATSSDRWVHVKPMSRSEAI